MNQLSYWIALPVQGFDGPVHYRVHFSKGIKPYPDNTPCTVAKINLSYLPGYKQKATGDSEEQAARNLAIQVNGELVIKNQGDKTCK